MLLLLWGGSALAATWPTGGPAGGDDPAPWTTDPLGVEIQDRVVGTGLAVAEGAEAVVNYTGMLADGTVFDATADRGQPFTFRVGTHQVIRGWEDGVVGMKVGGIRRLVIPPELGYGARDMGAIPPNSALYFEIQLVSVTPPREAPSAPAQIAEWQALKDGVRWADVTAGDGDRVRSGRRVCVDWAAWKGSERIESTWTRSRCTWASLDGSDLPGPVEEALVGMRVGGVRQIVVPDGTVVYQVALGGTGK